MNSHFIDETKASTSDGVAGDERAMNRATVERFFHCHGLERAALFTPDAVKTLPWTPFGEPMVIEGSRALKYSFIQNLTLFRGWSWANVEIWETQDRHRFWVEADGAGTIHTEHHDPVAYANHYIMSFELAAGRIRHFREFNNPLWPLSDLDGNPAEMPPLPDYRPSPDWAEPADWTPQPGAV